MPRTRTSLPRLRLVTGAAIIGLTAALIVAAPGATTAQDLSPLEIELSDISAAIAAADRTDDVSEAPALREQLRIVTALHGAKASETAAAMLELAEDLAYRDPGKPEAHSLARAALAIWRDLLMPSVVSSRPTRTVLSDVDGAIAAGELLNRLDYDSALNLRSEACKIADAELSALVLRRMESSFSSLSPAERTALENEFGLPLGVSPGSVPPFSAAELSALEELGERVTQICPRPMEGSEILRYRRLAYDVALADPDISEDERLSALDHVVIASASSGVTDEASVILKDVYDEALADPNVSERVRLSALAALVRAMQASGDPSEASAMLDDLFTEAMAQPPPTLANPFVIENMGYRGEQPLPVALAAAGRWDDVRAFYARYPPDTLQFAYGLLEASSIMQQTGDEFDDVDAHEQALAILVRLSADDDLHFASLGYQMALRRSGLTHTEIIQRYRTLFGDDHRLVATAMEEETDWVGLNQRGTLRIEETPQDCARTASLVLELNRDALSIWRRHYPPDDPDLLSKIAFAADAHDRGGALAEAAALYEEAARIDLLYDLSLSTKVQDRLASVRIRLGEWEAARDAVEEGFALLDIGVEAGSITDWNRDFYDQSLSRQAGQVQEHFGLFEEAASFYRAALPGSPLADCFTPLENGVAGYAWACRGKVEPTVCEPATILDEASSLADLATLLATRVDRPDAGTRLAWFASFAVVEDTRERYAFDFQAKKDFGRFPKVHQTFITAAWAATQAAR